ncbi:MAG: glycosyl transferase family 36 [Deltaproteobacteria bacterium]|nr:glycosyl transferase family 36 [Deltaproteobacteria bacterium]
MNGSSRIENAYGYYDAPNREFVITRPDTPTPWINYLGEGQYGGIISNTAGGYSFDRDPRNRRVTRYRYNGIPVDQPGRYIYLRDQETGEFWSPTWQPIPQRQLEDYECRHGTTYTRIQSQYKGINASVLYFVPLTSKDETCPCELWVLKVKNNSDKKRILRSFSYAEFSFRDAMSDMNNLDWAAHIQFSRYQDSIQYVGTKFNPTTSFMACNVTSIGHDSDREEFIGRYRDLANPVVVESGEPLNTVAPRGNNIGSFCHELVLEPGAETEIIFMLGITKEAEHVPEVVAKYKNSAAVKKAFETLKADWAEYLSKFSVDTPDPETNAMLNFWNQVQCRTTLYWSRFISAYETGLGRGMGTRDTGQDTLGTMHTVPEHARDMLTRIWRLQFQDGHTWHQFYPLTGEGGPGLAAEYPDFPQWFSDDHLWLIISVCAYLRETGDFDYLQQRVSYWDGEEETIWEHMLRGIKFTLEHRGPSGLPRIGFSDWDDTLNIDFGSGKAESVWVGMQFCRALLDLAELSDHIGKQEDAIRFRNFKAEMAEVINKVAWDGEWYARAYDNEGQPIGVASETHHKINLIPQAWSVIGEVAPIERAEKAMSSLHERLNTKFGVSLMWPAYNGGSKRVRGTTTYVPGAKENGGIFCHANSWVIVAAALLGQNDRAYNYYRQVLPLARKDCDHFLVEPYVYCQNICGPEHPKFGMGRNAWLTGTAAWTFVAGTQYVLGLRPTYDGLQIAPAIPTNWPGFTAKRVFRGTTYNIKVQREGPGHNVSLIVDGQPVKGNIAPLPAQKGGTVEVIAKLS